MDAHDRRVVHSRGRGDWETPPDLFAVLNDEFRFGVDAAADATNHLCPVWYGPGGYRETALGGEPWLGEEIFCNPPYGRGIRDWLDEGIAATLQGLVATVVFLLPARTDTLWFHRAVVPYAAEVRFVKGRLKFRLAGRTLDPAPFPSMIVIYRAASPHWAVMR